MTRKYIYIPADTRRFSWRDPDGDVGWFEPNGRIRITDDPQLTPNAQRWHGGEPIWSARILVGFNVGGKKRWKMDDVIKIVRRVRMGQVGDPGSSFVFQKGMYGHKDKTGKVKDIVVEDGAQIIVLNFDEYETSPAAFRKQMGDLGELLAEKLKQEAVIVELQYAGLSKGIGIMTPGRR